MLCFDIFPSFEHSNIIHSGGVWISGVSCGSTVPTLGSGSNARLFVSYTSALYLTHTDTAKPGKVHSDAQRSQPSTKACHKLNIAYVGDLKTMEGTNTQSNTSQVGSMVMVLQRQQTPLSAECGSRAGWKVRSLSTLSLFPQTPISIFSAQ